MTNKKLYLKSLAIAFAIEFAVLIFTLYPMMDGFWCIAQLPAHNAQFFHSF